MKIREVWPTENAAFTPWLQSHIGELDKVLGLGLSNPQREVGAGDFSIDLVAETNFGDVAIENQFGRSDHRRLGQLVTYFSHREVQRAIWIVEEARTERVKAVETLNDRGVGQIWMVTVRTIRIGDSPAAPLFTVVAEPSEDAMVDGMPDPTSKGMYKGRELGVRSRTELYVALPAIVKAPPTRFRPMADLLRPTAGGRHRAGGLVFTALQDGWRIVAYNDEIPRRAVAHPRRR